MRRCLSTTPSTSRSAMSARNSVSDRETLRTWKRSSEVDSGVRPGVMSDEHAEIRRFKRENAELRRAKEILKSASASFRGGTRRPTTR